MVPPTGLDPQAVRGNGIPARIVLNPEYEPSELDISLRVRSEYSGEYENYDGNSERSVPRAPRQSNLTTPETMSPLFPSSEVGSRRSYSTTGSNVRTSSVRDNKEMFVFSNSNIIGSRISSDSDVKRMNNYHNRCREIAENITAKYDKNNSSKSNPFSTKNIKGFLSRRK
jgi:hypothetical protein